MTNSLAFTDADHARRVLAYCDDAVLRREAQAYVDHVEIEAERLTAFFYGWDD